MFSTVTGELALLIQGRLAWIVVQVADAGAHRRFEHGLRCLAAR
jgi:hypothetical protein